MAAPPGRLLILVCFANVVGGWRWHPHGFKHRVPREERRCAPDPKATEIGERSTCPFDVVLNVDAKRIPAEVPMAACRCPKFSCGSDRVCVTLSYLIDVYYNVSGVLKPRKLESTSGCVCAAILGGLPTRAPPVRLQKIDDPGYYLMQ